MTEKQIQPGKTVGKKVGLPVSLGTRMGVTLSVVIIAVVMTVTAVTILNGIHRQGKSFLGLTQNLLNATRPAITQALRKDSDKAIHEYLGYLSLNPQLSDIELRIGNRTVFAFHGNAFGPSWIADKLIPEAAASYRHEETIAVIGNRAIDLSLTFSAAGLNTAINNIIVETGLIGISTLMILLTLMILVLEHYTAPLKPLTVLAERLSRGEWDNPPQPRFASSKEIVEINEALARGSETIRHYVESLEATRAELGQSEGRLRSLINGMHEILFEIDESGHITFLNPAWKTITGFDVDKSLGRKFSEFLVDQVDRDLFEQQDLAELKHKNREIRLKTNNWGSVVWVTMEASAQIDNEGRFTGVVGTLGDITESVELNHMLSEYQEELYHLSVTDPLTSLYNRRHFDTQFDIILFDHRRSGSELCLMLIDIDGFKFINDTYGHPVGDKVLRGVGDMLSNWVSGNHYFARIGGDEFAVVLSDTRLKDVTEIAHRLHRDINDIRIGLPVGQMRIQCSIGVSGYPYHGDNTQDLVKAADAALYQSKRAGRNRIRILSADTDQATMTIFNKGFQLRDALENGDINPVFQPICDIKTGKPVAYEVLARMLHNDAIIPAKDFITIAEELGLTRDVDLHIIEKALKLAPKNQPLFLNVGLSSFNDRPFVQKLHRLFKRATEKGQLVTIEITERDIVPLTTELLDDINSLRELGCKLALDDFGSGYSTYHFLNFFQPDYIKIEGTFVQGMMHSDSDRRIVEHIHELARSFGMETIAENIENKETLVALQSIGINGGQGMYFGSPKFLN